MENKDLTDAEKVSYGLSGVRNGVQWMTRPWTWFLFMLPAVGIVRMVTWWVNQEASGEPLVWAGLRISQHLNRRLEAAREIQRYGPERPDRVKTEPDGLTVLSCRPKPAWNPRVTIEVDGRFYRLLKIEERQLGSWWVHAYVLGEYPENEVIRTCGPVQIEKLSLLCEDGDHAHHRSCRPRIGAGAKGIGLEPRRGIDFSIRSSGAVSFGGAARTRRHGYGMARLG